MAGPPLSTLLSQVVVAHTIELDNEFERRFAEAGGGARVTSWTMWANLLRFVGEGITVGDLGAAVGLPKSSVQSRIGGVERWGYASVGPPSGRREGYGSARGLKDDWVVRLTAAGRNAAGIWPVLPAEVESRWRDRFGAAEIERLAEALREVDAGIENELPEYLPIVSSANGMALVLGDVPPPTGVRTLVSLVSHALMAYTLELEAASPLSLPLSANVVRVLGAEPLPVRDLPSLAGISKEAVEVSLTALGRTGFTVVEGAPASKRTIRLTREGDALRADQRRLHGRIAKRWETRYGAGVVASLRASLEHVLDHPELSAGLTPHPGGWRASKPYAARTQAVLADPRGRLPRYPMVLHRGGWPDGS
jgi:hypothetical protein